MEKIEELAFIENRRIGFYKKLENWLQVKSSSQLSRIKKAN